jgi:hypothetical protein
MISIGKKLMGKEFSAKNILFGKKVEDEQIGGTES